MLDVYTSLSQVKVADLNFQLKLVQAPKIKRIFSI